MTVMEAQQSATNEKNPTPKGVASNDLRYDTYIDYCAVGGLITNDDGSFRKLTSEELARELGVNRTTLWRWQETIPNFQERVRSRRIELSKRSRASKVYNGLYLRAAQGFAAEVRLWAEIFDGYQPAPQRLQHSLGDGFADAMKIARTRREGAIEGEVVKDNEPN
jgi:hypothetical protein